MFLTVIEGPHRGATVPLDTNATVGRDPDCDLVLDRDERISRHHVGFAPQADGQVAVSDLGSTNGVFIDGRRVTGSVAVRSGDTVRVGQTVLGLRTTDPSTGPATVLGGSRSIVSAPPTAAPLDHRPGGPVPPPAPVAPSFQPPAAPRRAHRRLWAAAAVAALVATTAGVVGVASRDGGGDDASLTAAQISEQSASAVLQVQSAIDGQLIGTGTGWVYDLDQGLIVTNYHVIGSGKEFSVGLGPARREATLVGAAPCEDLAVLRVDRTSDLTELELGDQDELSNGDPVVALGYPATASQTARLITSTGSVSSSTGSFDAPALDLPRYPDVILTQTPINPGNSGGPLLDENGLLVGVNSAGSLATQNQNYAIGVDRVREIVPELSRGDSLGWTGLLLGFPASAAEIEALGGDASLLGSAIFALDAVPQSAAANTGLFRQLEGAVVPIVSIDGVAMDGTLQTYCDAVGSNQRGDSADLSVTDGFDVFDLPLSFS